MEKSSFLAGPQTNITRNFIRYQEATTWNSLSSKESTAKILNEFKRPLTKFDISKINFDPTVAVIKHEDKSYE